MEEIIRVKKIKHQDLTNYYISKDGRIYNNKYIELAKIWQQCYDRKFAAVEHYRSRFNLGDNYVTSSIRS